MQLVPECWNHKPKSFKFGVQGGALRQIVLLGKGFIRKTINTMDLQIDSSVAWETDGTEFMPFFFFFF